MKQLADYYDPKLSDEAGIWVPNKVLRPLADPKAAAFTAFAAEHTFNEIFDGRVTPPAVVCCKGLAPASECRCEQERKAAGHPPYYRSAATVPPADGALSDDWKSDPSADERWQAGLDFGMLQLCQSLGVDPKSVTWDAATETLDGDVCAVIWNILRAKMGDDWDPHAPPSGTGAAEPVALDIDALRARLPRHASSRARDIAQEAMRDMADERRHDGGNYALARWFDAILSLPVQSSAPVAQEMPAYEKRALGIIKLATEQAEEIRSLSSAPEATVSGEANRYYDDHLALGLLNNQLARLYKKIGVPATVEPFEWIAETIELFKRMQAASSSPQDVGREATIESLCGEIRRLIGVASDIRLLTNAGRFKEFEDEPWLKRAAACDLQRNLVGELRALSRKGGER